MKRYQRFTSLLLTVCMVLTMFTVLGMTAAADPVGTELPDVSVSLDFGVPMTISPLEGSEVTGSITAIRSSEDGADATELTLSYGTAKLNADGKTVTFTPTSMVMSAPEHIYYVVGDQTGRITIVPATNIYFDDSFSAITYGGNWETVGTTYTGEQAADLVGDENANLYGYDDFNNSYDKYSFGSSKHVHVRAGRDRNGSDNTIDFTFYGTGFDYYISCSPYAGSHVVELYNSTGELIRRYLVHANCGWVRTEEEHEYTAYPYSIRYRKEGSSYIEDQTGRYAKSQKTSSYVYVDQFYDADGNPDDTNNYFKEVTSVKWAINTDGLTHTYHDPAVQVLDLPADTYRVAARSYYHYVFDAGFSGFADVYFDGLRIYGACEGNDEAEAAYLKDIEGNPYYVNMRTLLLEQEDGEDTGIISEAGGLFVDGNNNAAIGVYKEDGPKGEVYLAKNQAIALDLHFDEVPDSVQFSAKTAEGDATTGIFVQSVDGREYEINGTVSMYHDITNLVDFVEDPEGGYTTRNPIIFMNKGDTVTSLVMFKCTGGAPKAAITDQETAKDIVEDITGGGDGTPDKYQKPVTFVVVNGVWDDGTEDDQNVTLTLLDEQGDWSETGSADLTSPEDMQPAEGYGNGIWDVVPPSTVSGTHHEIFTYSFEPTEAPYQVEHYKQQTDGGYKLEETEEDLIGTIGEAAEATPKDYENYEVNENKSELKGIVYLPEAEEEAPLTLKVYYDLIKHTVTYDLNGGTGSGYDPADYFHGTEATVKGAPTYEGYTFLGWSDGTTTYQPEDVLTVNADIHLTAQWEKKETPTESTQPTTPSDPNKPSTGDMDNPILWIALLGISLIGAAAIIILAISKSRKNKR